MAKYPIEIGLFSDKIGVKGFKGWLARGFDSIGSENDAGFAPIRFIDTSNIIIARQQLRDFSGNLLDSEAITPDQYNKALAELVDESLSKRTRFAKRLNFYLDIAAVSGEPKAALSLLQALSSRGHALTKKVDDQRDPFETAFELCINSDLGGEELQDLLRLLATSSRGEHFRYQSYLFFACLVQEAFSIDELIMTFPDLLTSTLEDSDHSIIRLSNYVSLDTWNKNFSRIVMRCLAEGKTDVVFRLFKDNENLKIVKRIEETERNVFETELHEAYFIQNARQSLKLDQKAFYADDQLTPDEELDYLDLVDNVADIDDEGFTLQSINSVRVPHVATSQFYEQQQLNGPDGDEARLLGHADATTPSEVAREPVGEYLTEASV